MKITQRFYFTLSALDSPTETPYFIAHPVASYHDEIDEARWKKDPAFLGLRTITFETDPIEKSIQIHEREAIRWREYANNHENIIRNLLALPAPTEDQS